MERTALITGASGGIGRAIAESLAPTFHLYLAGRNRESLENLAAGLPSAKVLIGDLATESGIASVTSGVQNLDVLIHSAGVLHLGTVEELSLDQWRESLELNLLAPVALTQALLPQLRQSAGHLVMVNSGLGHRSVPGSGAYSASKFGMRAFADALRLEEGPRGVRVTSVHPGRVDTPMQEQMHSWEQKEYDGGAWIHPTQVASVVLSALDLGSNAAIDSININPAHQVHK
ncbi:MULTISPECIES: SDR family oxidoreductase [Arthrobacter]|uniref:Short chain dehydrogenase n=1 Tax=Arthrobacter psychrochitiniphilus TaxID=291045 RepID=A0A2V3DMV4_9MICC|nr:MULTISPECIES: SDR family oxidoreductase [Arthrobacter]MDJ0318641.1 SDR family oxidoreductase [Arthrobacter sp. H35-MC1]NYG17457.1 NADP-dependent 3-hydroxy acid dehydrogenase YdfG [Arthrobacter psychrochitiniphilus]PXA64087.1 short chain dehydrogenase [Arthrobacter psychrochitiniphilus]